MAHGADLLVLRGKIAVVRELRIELRLQQLVFHLELHAPLGAHHGAKEQRVRHQKQRRHDQQHRRVLIPRRIEDERLNGGGVEDLRDRKDGKNQQLPAGEVIPRAQKRQADHQQHQRQKQQEHPAVQRRVRVCPDGIVRVHPKVRRAHGGGGKQHLHQHRRSQLRRDREQLSPRLAVKEQKRQRQRPRRIQQQAQRAARRRQQQHRQQVGGIDHEREQHRAPPRKARPVEHAPQKHAPRRHDAGVEQKVRPETVIRHRPRPPVHPAARCARPAAGKTPRAHSCDTNG